MRDIRVTGRRATTAALLLVLSPTACSEDAGPTVWERDGEPVDTGLVESHRGEEHCGHDGVTVLRVAWPLGHSGGRPRTYVRDPDGVLADSTESSFQDDAGLSASARSSGYSSEVGELWFDAVDRDRVAYVVTPDGDVEAWPRTTGLLGCD